MLFSHMCHSCSTMSRPVKPSQYNVLQDHKTIDALLLCGPLSHRLCLHNTAFNNLQAQSSQHTILCDERFGKRQVVAGMLEHLSTVGTLVGHMSTVGTKVGHMSTAGVAPIKHCILMPPIPPQFLHDTVYKLSCRIVLIK